MTAFQNLQIEVRGHVGIVTLNRPKALNALNSELLRELDTAIANLEQDTAVRVMILTGGGEKAFVAGADIAEMRALSPAEARTFARFGQGLFARIERLPKVVIAAINGFALGGGCELAMACDIRIATETSKFGQPEVGLGITPGFGGTQRLPRLVGRGRALELLCAGAIIDAAEALRIGLVNRLVPPGQALEAALALANTIAAKSPVAVRQIKAAFAGGHDCTLATAVDYEAEVFALCFAERDQQEGMTAFLEKRAPVF